MVKDEIEYIEERIQFHILMSIEHLSTKYSNLVEKAVKNC